MLGCTININKQSACISIAYLAIPILLSIHPSPSLDNNLHENPPEPTLLPTHITDITIRKINNIIMTIIFKLYRIIEPIKSNKNFPLGLKATKIR